MTTEGEVRVREVKREDLPYIREFVRQELFKFPIQRLIIFDFQKKSIQTTLITLTFLLRYFAGFGVIQLLLFYWTAFAVKVAYDVNHFKNEMHQLSAELDGWDQLKSTVERTFVAEILTDVNGRKSSEIVGCCSIRKPGEQFYELSLIKSHHGSTAEFSRFFVKNQHQRKGIGKRLLKQAMEYAKEREYDTIFLYTRAITKAGIPLYKRNGFKLVFVQKIESFVREFLFFSKSLK